MLRRTKYGALLLPGLASLEILGGGCSPAPTGADQEAGASVPQAVDRRDAGEDAGAADGGWSLAPIVLDLGTVEQGQTREFQLPPHALGFHIVVVAEGAGLTAVQTVTTPSGVRVIEDAGHRGQPVPGLTSDTQGAVGVQLPSTDLELEASLAPGASWNVTFALPPGRTGRATIHVPVTDDGAWHGGELQLAFFVPDGVDVAGAGGITAQTAAESAAVLERTERLRDNMKRLLDVDLTSVTYHPLPASFRTLDTEAKRIAAARAAVDGGPAPLRVILTDDLGGAVGGLPLVGLAPGIGGVVPLAGTARSALFYAPRKSNAAGLPPAPYDGDILTHELGHFVGLTHSTELGSQWFDAFADTPRCTSLTSVDAGGACPDRQNLMFIATAARQGAAPVISASQRRSLTGSPLFRAYRSDAARDAARRARGSDRRR